MAEVELSIGASHLELRFSGGDGAAAADRAPPAIVVPLPKPVDPDAAEGKHVLARKAVWPRGPHTKHTDHIDHTMTCRLL